MSGLDPVQKNRLSTHIRGLMQTPEWRDIKRFIVAASADDDPASLDHVHRDIALAFTVALEQERDAALEQRRRERSRP